MEPPVRHLRNTRGDWTGFVADGHVFSPDCAWLGVVQRDEVYDTEGNFVGQLRPDGRVVRHRGAKVHKHILRPRQPLRPRRPLPPKRGLFLPMLPPSFEDVLLSRGAPIPALVPLARLDWIDTLVDCTVIAEDRAFLGRISRDPDERDSIGNPAGPHGSEEAEASILNPRGRYGSETGALSAFNPSTTSPPLILRAGEGFAFLSTNRRMPDRLDPRELIAWLRRA